MRLPRLLSLQGKMTAVFLLMTLLAMQVIGAGLLYQLQQYYLGTTRQQLSSIAGAVVAQAAGVLADGLGLAQLRPLVEGAVQPPATGALLLDASGRVAYSTGLPEALVGRRYRLPGPLAAAARGVSATALVRVASGETQIWAATPVRVDGRVAAVVLVESSASQIYYIIRHVRHILLTWTLLALAVSGALSVLLARTVTGPIEALTRRARAMAAGDFAGRLPVRSRDEVGQLALVFNHLAHRLQETLDEIRGEQRRAGAILTNMTDGILALDANGRVLLCNPAAAAMLGVDAAAVAGRRVEDALPAALAEVLRENGRAAAGDGRQRPGRAGHAGAGDHGSEPLASRPGPPGVAVSIDGRHLLAHVAPLVEGDTPRGTVVVIQDVTAREREEARRKEFVANVSHDLRTPITTIGLYAETLLEWGLTEPDEARAKLEVIVDETRRMSQLIDDLLELSRLDAQGVVRRRAHLDLGALCAQVVARQQERARQKSLEVSIDPPPEPVHVEADGDRLVRVVANLLANAIEFTEPGGQVAVRVRREGGRACVSVRDTGIGIPPADLERVFERFYRVDPSRSREHGGSGLGLAIAREIVEAHGGRITAESAGRGTTVRFELPLTVPGPGEPAVPAPSALDAQDAPPERVGP